MEAQKSRIDEALAIPAHSSRIMARIGAMFLGYNNLPRRSQEEHEAVLKVYADALNEIPEFVLAEVLAEYKTGKRGNPDFPPNAPKLAKECREQLFKYKGQSNKIGNILNASVYQEQSEEDRKRMAAKMSEFAKSFSIPDGEVVQ